MDTKMMTWDPKRSQVDDLAPKKVAKGCQNDDLAPKKVAKGC